MSRTTSRASHVGTVKTRPTLHNSIALKNSPDHTETTTAVQISDEISTMKEENLDSEIKKEIKETKYFLCVEEAGVACRNTPFKDDRCRGQGVESGQYVSGVLTDDNQWIIVGKSPNKHFTDLSEKFLPIRLIIHYAAPEIMFRQVSKEEAVTNQATFSTRKVVSSIDKIPLHAVGIQSEYAPEQLASTKFFRHLLSKTGAEHTANTQGVVDAEPSVIPRMLDLLQQKSSSDHLKCEAAWALTNIASSISAHTQHVIDAGAVPILIHCLSLSHNSVELRDQCVWALGNIAGDSVQTRDIVLQANVLAPLLALFETTSNEATRTTCKTQRGRGSEPQLEDPTKEGTFAKKATCTTSLSLRRNATWALSNLCRGKPKPRLESIRPALPTLVSLLREGKNQDEEILADACWALSYVSDGHGQDIDAVLSSGAAPHLVNLLLHTSSKVQVPTLRAVGNIVTGDDVQTKQVLDCPHVLHNLVELLSWDDDSRQGFGGSSSSSSSHASKAGLTKEACWTLSNITAGNQHQVKQVVNTPHAISRILHLLRTAKAKDDSSSRRNLPSAEIKKEAAWVLSNATSGGADEDMITLISKGCLLPMCQVLDDNASTARTCTVALEGLENFLNFGEKLKTVSNHELQLFSNLSSTTTTTTRMRMNPIMEEMMLIGKEKFDSLTI